MSLDLKDLVLSTVTDQHPDQSTSHLQNDVSIPQGREAFKPALVAPTLDEIDEEPLRWLWQNRIPLGTVTLLVAEPNAGKSYLTVALAAAGSRGDVLPGNDEPLDFATLLFEMEDTKGTVKERAHLCKAVGNRVRVSNSVARSQNTEASFSLADIDLLESHLCSEPDTRLVIINPLAAIMDANTNDYRELDVRRVIAKLEKVARKHDVAIIAVRHFGKQNANQNRSGMERVLGSIGLVAAARSVLGIDCDGDRRYLVSIKNNVGKPPAAVAFCITDEGLTFEGEDPNYRSANEPAHPESRFGQCVAWMRSELAPGELSSTELETRAVAAGHSRKTCQRAKGRSEFRSFQRQDDGRRIWFTKLAEPEAEKMLADGPGEATLQERIA